MDVSVVIPAFNAQKTLKRAIESACNQTMPPKEVIVVDDGSTDGTPKVVEELKKLYPSIISYYQPNAGLSAARNKGILSATSQWVAFLDSDDWWNLGKLEEQSQSLDRSKADLVYTTMFMHMHNGDVRRIYLNRNSDSLSALRYGNSITPSTVVVKRDALLQVGLFDENLRGAEDWDIWVRLAIQGASFSFLDSPLLHYTESSGSLSAGARMLTDELTVLQKGNVLHGLTGAERAYCAKKIRAAIYCRAALVDRARNNRNGELKKILRSILEWPFPTFMKARYMTCAVSALRFANLR